MKQPIYTEKHSCQDCYKCVRSCPVKSIELKDGSAIVNPDNCIYCGQCVEICPVNAKKIRDDLPRVKQLLKIKKVAISLSPSFYSEFSTTAPRVITFLKNKGIEIFSDTAIGAVYLNRDLNRIINSNDSWITTACPVVVDYVNLYRRDLKDYLTPTASPMVIHGRLLKEELGDEYAVVFLGPCIAKKREADLNPESIDVALTFQELQNWIDETGGLPFEDDPMDYDRSQETAIYPIDGGMIRSMGLQNRNIPNLAISGISTIINSLEDWSPDKESGVIECLSCSGGCINGPARVITGDKISKHKYIESLYPLEKTNDSNFQREAKTASKEIEYKKITRTIFSEEQINAALIELDKANPEDQLNCGGCGYQTCYNFAISFLEHKSEREMCTGNMRKLAQKKVNALIKALPIAVVMVDQDLNIVELNGPFLKYFSEADTENYEEINRLTKGLKVDNFAPVKNHFLTTLKGNNIHDERIDFEGRVYQSTFFSVEPARLAGALFIDITQPAIKRDTIIAKAEEVIKKNLESVQQIASVLGETAAETEIILNSVIDALNPERKVLE